MNERKNRTKRKRNPEDKKNEVSIQMLSHESMDNIISPAGGQMIPYVGTQRIPVSNWIDTLSIVP